MSLLRNVLKKNTANTDVQPAPGLSDKTKAKLFSLSRKLGWDPVNGDKASIKSSSGMTVYSVRSIAESVTSFASTLLGGKRVPKRRRPDVSRLGAPKWYDKSPPDAPEMPGTERVDISNRPFQTTHAYSFSNPTAQRGQPYICIILHNHAAEGADRPRYYDGCESLFLMKHIFVG